jgi:Copper amine oxidase, enzyme domain
MQRLSRRGLTPVYAAVCLLPGLALAQSPHVHTQGRALPQSGQGAIAQLSPGGSGQTPGGALSSICVQNPNLCVPSICLQNPAQCGLAPALAVGGCEPHSPAPAGLPSVPGGSAVAYQQFPPKGAMKTAWFVTFDHAVHRGLFITSAYFKAGPDKPWLKVLAEAGPGELFVPYQPGSPRFQDLANFDFQMVTATPADAGACGMITGNEDKVIREVVDKGPLWKDDAKVYRGHKMTLWATLDAANYNYIFSYTFHDDGMIEFRAAGTAVNLPSMPTIAHMHNIIWRINMDLNGQRANTLRVVRHLETTTSPAWTDVHEPFNGNKEGSLEWQAKEFTTLHVTAPSLVNGRGSPSGYMIMPNYRGIARHQETWMQKDIWVTRYQPGELTFRNIEAYANGEPINEADIVIWLVSPVLHLPRDEDGGIVDGFWSGVALAMWTGFDMKPHNIFDTTPFYP